MPILKAFSIQLRHAKAGKLIDPKLLHRVPFHRHWYDVDAVTRYVSGFVPEL